MSNKKVSRQNAEHSKGAPTSGLHAIQRGHSRGQETGTISDGMHLDTRGMQHG